MGNLPAGVNERDLAMFTQSQEAAKEFLHRENMGIASLPHAISGATDAPVGVSTTVSKGGPDHGVPSQIAVPHLSASTPGKFLITRLLQINIRDSAKFLELGQEQNISGQRNPDAKLHSFIAIKQQF